MSVIIICVSISKKLGATKKREKEGKTWRKKAAVRNKRLWVISQCGEKKPQ